MAVSRKRKRPSVVSFYHSSAEFNALSERPEHSDQLTESRFVLVT